MRAVGGAVGEVQCDGRRLDRHRGVFLENDARAQRAHIRIGDAGILVLREACGAEQERNGGAVLQADLGVAPARDFGPVGALAHQRVAAHGDAADRVRRRAVTGAQFETGIDDREQHDAARIGLVGVRQYLPAFAEPAGHKREIDRVAGHRGEPVAPFDRRRGSGKPAVSEQRGGQSVLRAALPTPRLLAMLPRLSTRLADCVAAWPRAQAVCRASSRSRREQAEAAAENPAGRGDVPAAPVMRRHHAETDPAAGFEAEHKCMQQRGARDRPLARPAPGSAARPARRDVVEDDRLVGRPGDLLVVAAQAAAVGLVVVRA